MNRLTRVSQIVLAFALLVGFCWLATPNSTAMPAWLSSGLYFLILVSSVTLLAERLERLYSHMGDNDENS